MAPVNQLLGRIATILNGLPDVFSTSQWGGRAYKLPGPNGSRKKPKLLAVVAVAKDETAVSVVFKPPKESGDDAVKRFEWIGRFKFGALEKTGWVEARVSDGRQLRTLERLLKECRDTFPKQERAPSGRGDRTKASPAGTNPVVRRIERVMAEAKSEGWAPPETSSKT